MGGRGRVALYLQDKHPIRDGMEYARLAEQHGFEAVWQAESRLVREATVPMAAYAAVTSQIKVGSGVINTWTRNVGVTRRLLAMERVTFHGEFVNVTDIEIDIVHGDRSPKRVPIYVGATGMKMMELAGEIGDGVVLNYMVSPSYTAQAVETLAAGAARAGRTLADV